MQDIIVKAYSILLRLNNLIQDVLSLKNMTTTVKALLAAICIFIATFWLSDSVFLWLFTNLAMCFPLAYNKKKQQIDTVIAKINEAIDK